MMSSRDWPSDSRSELPSESRQAKASVKCQAPPPLRQNSFPPAFPGSELGRGFQREYPVRLDEPRPDWPR